MPNPQLFIELEKLYSICYERVRNFPKLDKHMLGKEILGHINDTHKASLLSTYNKSYLPHSSASWDLVKKSLRLALERKLISEGWYASQLDLIVSIGKEIGGRIRKSKTPNV